MDIWKKLNETEYNLGFRKLIKKDFILPNGNIEEFYIKNEGNVVCILPITENNNIVLAKQYRPGPEKILFELPGGSIENNEFPIDAARRELLEETGYFGSLSYVGKTYSCAYSNMTRFNFVATNCKKISNTSNDKNEFTEPVEISVIDFIEYLKNGELTDLTTGFLGLLYLNILKI